MIEQPAIHSSHLTTDEDGFFDVRCTCGEILALVPDFETAADVLMDHAAEKGYERGHEDGLNDVRPR